MRVFISSTYTDLVEHRKAVANALERMELKTGRMEVFCAQPDSPLNVSLEEGSESDLFVGIYAHRYGFIPENQEFSMIELEFNHAMEKGIPIFAFLVDPDYDWPDEYIEQEPERSMLENFKNRVQSALVRELFTSPDDLAMKAASSIARYTSRQLEKQMEELQRLTKERGEERQKIGIQAEVLQTRVKNLDLQEEKLYRILNLLPQLRELLPHTYSLGLEDAPAQTGWKSRRNNLLNTLAELCGGLSISDICKSVLDIFHVWNGRRIAGLGSISNIPPEYEESLEALQKHIEHELKTTKFEREKVRAKLEEIIT